jgi:hypothetical protein
MRAIGSDPNEISKMEGVLKGLKIALEIIKNSNDKNMHNM